MTVQLVAHVHGHTERHLRARKDWPENAIMRNEWSRNATAIGNPRAVPYLRDMLQVGLDSGADVVVVTNDDVSFSEGAFEKIARHCQVFEFGCVRREAGHVGREAVFFLSSWLKEHINQMPDVIICTERWDLVIAKWMRKFYGFTCTEQNWADDFFPVELEPGLVHHEPHGSYWAQEPYQAAAMYNIRLWEAP